MSVNLIAINIGNTRTQVAAVVDGEVIDVVACDPQDTAMLTDAVRIANAELVDKTQRVAMVASVNSEGEDVIDQVVRETIEARTTYAHRDVPIPIGLQLDPEAIVGVDRLVNAAAAYDVLKQSCVVVDAGTAVTVDFVDGTGTFHGGAIAPGARLMMRSLHKYTSQLPEVEPAAPIEPVGHNTVEAMRTGVYYGLRGMVRELVEQFAQVAGTFPLVVATGGDAQWLFEDFDLLDRLVPDLTLRGLAVTLRAALERET